MIEGSAVKCEIIIGQMNVFLTLPLGRCARPFHPLCAYCIQCTATPVYRSPALMSELRSDLWDVSSSRVQDKLISKTTRSDYLVDARGIAVRNGIIVLMTVREN